MIPREVSLVNVTRDEAIAASELIEYLFQKYRLSTDDRDALWTAAQMALTYALLEEGKIPGTSDGT